ncbi:unnamed protein product, partial [Iphiclides podalirius]
MVIKVGINGFGRIGRIMFRTCYQNSNVEGHMAGDGVRRVVVTAPSVDVPMVIMGVNEDKLQPAQDIYDKLDSTSATNSENSFDVNEKQSQVIYINDLTNSLEDLGRLEKICKIIEISDDLSDELFAKLQVNDSEKSKNNKWSFKDLCDKIDLDDFCNKTFRETNV